MNSWITNALTSQRTTIGGIITAVGAALLGAEAAGIQHVPDWLKLCGLILSAVGPVILGTQARQGNVTSEQVKAASAPKPPDYLNLGMILCLIGAAATFSGCAFTRQSVRTMDGDKFSQFAGSTLGKQDSTQKVDADFYPNNTGSHISVGGQTEQDSTAMVPIINALVGALVHQGGGTADTPAERTRLEKLEAQIEALRRLIEMTRPTEAKP